MDKLIRQLRRELTANPKKSALLGLGLLAAIYFWAPLVAGWFSDGDSGNSKTAKSEASAAPQSGGAGETAPAPLVSLLGADWRELARRMENEPLRNLAGLAAPLHDPFLRAPAATGNEPLPVAAGTPALETIASPNAPRGQEWKLEAVLIRGARRAAIINGAVYRKGETLGAAGANDASNRPGPKVLEIHASHVEIGWGETTMRLELERTELAPGDRIAPMPGSN
jgi:hypothetical protein